MRTPKLALAAGLALAACNEANEPFASETAAFQAVTTSLSTTGIPIQDIADLYGCAPAAINDHGAVAGSCGRSNEIVFVWYPDRGRIDLGFAGRAQAINDAGHVVGSLVSSTGERYAFLWTPEAGLTTLPTLGGSFGSAEAINDWGEVVGASLTATGAQHAFRWTSAGGIVDLGCCVAIDIANTGRAVGQGLDASVPRSIPLLWLPHDGTLDLANSGAPVSAVNVAINESTEVVGEDMRGFIYVWAPKRGSVSLPLPAGAGRPADINNAGTVVGEFDSPDGTVPLLWTREAGIVDLGTLGGDFGTAIAINDRGLVVGRALNAASDMRTVIWRTGF
jgi:probable HAF family extracellular repeat protein